MEKVFYTLPVFFPILATLGAIVLNNGGSDILTLILLAAIAIYSLLLVLFRDKIAVDLYPYALFFIGIASLFTTSLRSWYITGHDIEREFYVFQLTNTHHIWKMAFYQDAYNSCLSITILPTVLTNLLSIQDIYIYKVVFQIVFAISPILVFFIIVNYTIPVFAFISAFFFMSFPTFFNDMPMLNRQEIGFLFFGLVLYMMLLSKLSFSMRKILFIVFALGVIVSHYSTNFVLLALVTFAYGFMLIISLPWVKNTSIWLLAKFHINLINTSINWYASENTVMLPKIVRADSSSQAGRSQKGNTRVAWCANEGRGMVPPMAQADHGSQIGSGQRGARWYADEDTVVLAAITPTNPSSIAFHKKINLLATSCSVIVHALTEVKTLGNRSKTHYHNMFLSFPLVLLLFLMTYVWNNVYTNSANHAGSVISEVVSNLFVKSDADAKSIDVSYSIFSAPKKEDPKQELQDYIHRILQSDVSPNKGKVDTSQFYSRSITNKYPSYSVPQDELAPTPLGNVLTTLHIPVFDIQAALRSLSADFLQIFVFIGLLAVLFLKNKRPFDMQYMLLCFGAVFLLILEIILPALSVEYGLLRMFQQLLFILSLPIAIGVYSVLFFVKEQSKILFVGIIAIFFFLTLTGFVSHLTGDYYPQMTLDNAGLYYHGYYVHKSDVAAIVWLSKHNVNHEPVEADTAGANKMFTYGSITAVNNIFPATVLRDAYVYLEVSTDTEISIDGEFITYTSSKPFLDENKNLIYSNGENDIYK